jgi:hypothetical protein
VIEPHLQQTAERVRQAKTVVVIHDTTELEYGGDAVRSGLGKLRNNAHGQGFFFHASLAVDFAKAARVPLGLLGMHLWTRERVTLSRRDGRARSGTDYAKQTDKESNRWGAQIANAAQLVGDAQALVHVADREADIFTLLASLSANAHRFVIRLARDRRAREDDSANPEKIRELMSRAEGELEVEVPVVARKPTTIPGHSKTFSERQGRIATVQYRAATAQLRRPQYLSEEPEWLDVNVVQVCETNPVDPRHKIDWVLLTTEPIDTHRDILAVVEMYRTRWLIEEYFKALKTGCAMEKRELESIHTLTNMLAIMAPIAWQMLLLRHLARAAPELPATAVLNEDQLHALATMRKAHPRTSVEALFAVAALAGHTTKKPPGWRVIAWGMQTLRAYEAALVAFRAEQKDPIKR